MLCTSASHNDVLNKEWKSDQQKHTRWKTDGVCTRNIDTSSWVNDIRGTEQEKLVEQALNLDLNNLSEKQLVSIFVTVTDEPECKAKRYIYDANKNLILAFQNYFHQQNKRQEPDDDLQKEASYSPTPTEEARDYSPSKEFATPVKRSTRQQRDSFSKDCDHRCCMVHADACCDCSDSRPPSELYDIYIKNEGICTTPYRWLFYCPVCKRRTQSHSPPRGSSSYAPLYRPKVRQRTCSKHRVCPPSCTKAKDSCVIC